EELEGRVHRAGARPPCSFGALLDLLHHLVAVARLLRDQEENRPAGVHTAQAPPARAWARNAHLEEHVALGAEAARAAGASWAERPGTPTHESVSSVHLTICIRYMRICQDCRVARVP